MFLFQVSSQVSNIRQFAITEKSTFTLFFPKKKLQWPKNHSLEIEEEPEKKENGKEIVLITHDESTFYCYEGQRIYWLENSKNKILPKSRGQSIMNELMPISFVPKAFDHRLRFMHGYRSGLFGPILEYAVKKYKSHRRLSPTIRLDEIASEFAEKRAKKITFKRCK